MIRISLDGQVALATYAMRTGVSHVCETTRGHPLLVLLRSSRFGFCVLRFFYLDLVQNRFEDTAASQ